MENNNTFTVSNLDQLDSPSILIFEENLNNNIDAMIAIAGDVKRLIPHIKTNKMENVIKLMLSKGIEKFKCSTIAEAELAAISGAKTALIAHQLVGPKIQRLLSLIKKYPNTTFQSIIDCNKNAEAFNEAFEKENLIAQVYYDINNGMNRSGHEINEDLLPDLEHTILLKNINLLGFHVYDGHIRDAAFDVRKNKIEQDLTAFYTLKNEHFPTLETISGGTPAFTSHAQENNRTLSPGTCVFWDWGYGDAFLEMPFNYAALILMRVISKPIKGIITVDMGHKAVSSENPIDKRIRFINNHDLTLISQSEEHGVISTPNYNDYEVGDTILGVPYHICPTINLYDEAYVIRNGTMAETWKIEGRKRKITI